MSERGFAITLLVLLAIVYSWAGTGMQFDTIQ